MKTVYTSDGSMTITKDNGTQISVSPTPAGVIVRDSEIGASTLHTGISKEEEETIRREVLEACRKEKK